MSVILNDVHDIPKICFFSLWCRKTQRARLDIKTVQAGYEADIRSLDCV